MLNNSNKQNNKMSDCACLPLTNMQFGTYKVEFMQIYYFNIKLVMYLKLTLKISSRF